METLTAPAQLLTPVQTAEQLGMTVAALAQMRYLGRGPKFLKLTARAVRYRQSDIDEWLTAAERTQSNRGPA